MHISKGVATATAVYGLIKLAEDNGHSISEEALIQIDHLVKTGNRGDTVTAADVLESVRSLNPGELYTRGLERIADTDGALKKAAITQVSNMTRDKAMEHIEPTKQAFRFLTGKEL